MVGFLIKMALGGLYQGSLGFCIDSLTQRIEINSSKRKARRAAEEDPDAPALKVKEYDSARSKRFGGVGALWAGPWGILKFTMLDTFIPLNRPFPDMLYKSGINFIVFDPISSLMGLSLNEYFKDPSQGYTNVLRRIRQEFMRVQLIKWGARPVTTYLTMIPPDPVGKFLVGSILNGVVLIYVSWRTNIDLEPAPGITAGASAPPLAPVPAGAASKIVEVEEGAATQPALKEKEEPEPKSDK
eukprot:TRINITY_DN87083_c0_g1_i1.p1 TRINITY_DN87083_c0_g1~~TRINITY_DN87083_c0_g1_i1.p1  ORF type:complete len:242 (+),score=43.14 TRINITY_DN87083_c0_g1_i1:148-873(+)